MPSFTYRIVLDESRYRRTWESWMPNEYGTTMPSWTAGVHRNGDCHKSEWPTPSPTPAEASPPFPGQRCRSFEERRDSICEHRKATVENGRSKCSKSVQPIQLKPRRDNATIRKVPIEFRGFHLPLAYGGDVKDCDRTAIDGFEDEIFNRPNGGFCIRVKALGFETDDFNVFIDPDGVLGVDALHEQQTRDGMSVQRRITRRYQALIKHKFHLNYLAPFFRWLRKWTCALCAPFSPRTAAIWRSRVRKGKISNRNYCLLLTSK
uniref:SHSP domain-containing protein n=1 Tax=Globodera pallida TaxID=36090 RepID=A0A183BWC2_GLOPA